MKNAIRFRNADLWWIGADLAALTAAYFVALFLRNAGAANRFLSKVAQWFFGFQGQIVSPVSLDFYLSSAPRIILSLAIPMILLYGLMDLYMQNRFLRPRPILWILCRANAAVFGLVVAFFYLRHNLYHPRGFILLVFTLNIVTTAAFRALLRKVLHGLRRRFDVGVSNALLIGSGRAADWIETLIAARHPHGIRVAEWLKQPVGALSDAEIRARLLRCRADLLIVADTECDVPRIMKLLDLAAELDLASKFLTEHLNVLQLKANVAVDTVSGVPLVHFNPPSVSRKDTIPRRVLSFCLAVTAVLASIPVMLLAALAIKLDDDGPLFFIQERIGVNRRPFRMYKFRTMHVDADQKQAELEELNETGRGLFKIRSDPRVTRAGRFLRKFSIDELPQLVNVLKGDMRIVGPRPLPRRDFANYYEDWHYSRHAGMPGLTCLWQISGRSEIDFENMCILDVYYLRNQDWALDLKVVLKTVWVVLFSRGAY